jgi:hypothetical protein
MSPPLSPWLNLSRRSLFAQVFDDASSVVMELIW